MVFAALLAATGCVSAIRGVRLEKVATRSMPAPVAVLVVTPPSYDSSPGLRYPVLYFLHDAYGDGQTLQRRGVAAEALARMRDCRSFSSSRPTARAPGSPTRTKARIGTKNS